MIAYDHSRVVLQPVDGVVGSDYLNANYCDGYRKQNAYIATQVNRLETPPSFTATALQGPLPETLADYWRMVWEQRSSTIVMLTRLEERARVKCDQVRRAALYTCTVPLSSTGPPGAPRPTALCASP